MRHIVELVKEMLLRAPGARVLMFVAYTPVLSGIALGRADLLALLGVSAGLVCIGMLSDWLEKYLTPITEKRRADRATALRVRVGNRSKQRPPRKRLRQGRR